MVAQSDLVVVTLAPNELIRLEDEYGSLKAAAEALPDQREEILAAVEKVGEISRRIREAAGSPPENLPELLEPLPPPLGIRHPFDDLDLDEIEPVLSQREIQKAIVAALAQHARSQMKAKPKKRKPGPAPKDIPVADFAKVVALLKSESDMKIAEIERKTGVDDHDIAKIRDWLNGRGYEVHPGSIPRTVILQTV